MAIHIFLQNNIKKDNKELCRVQYDTIAVPPNEILSIFEAKSYELIGCNEESCDRNNKEELQILDECKTINTEHLFRCDQGDALDDMRLQNGERMHTSDKHYKCDAFDKRFRQSGILHEHMRTQVC
jgi:hypothetical protein